MSKQPNDARKSDGAPKQPQVKSAAVLVLGDIADTTWRMFIPTIGSTMLGLYLDKQWHTAPWLMIGGIIIGASIATTLVRRQLTRVNSTTPQ